jgi:hypothetical protein
MTTRHIDTKQTEPGRFHSVAILRVPQNCGRHGDHFILGGWDETQTGRLAFGGPLVAGPMAYMAPTTPTQHIIDARTGSASEDALIEANHGDVLIVGGVAYTLTVNARFEPRLTRRHDPLTDDPRTARAMGSTASDPTPRSSGTLRTVTP